MHPQVAPLYEIARLNERLFLNALEGIDEDTGQKQPAPGLNNMTFLAIHILDARCYLSRILDAIAEHPYQEQLADVNSVSDMKKYPELEGIRVAWRESSEILVERLPELTDPELAEKSPADFPVADGTVLGSLAFLLQHESFHIGQLAYLRRLLGHEAMSYW
jgi:uncharacterized damage-inducible protein DinB